ncbi:MAG TPA: LamG-like jellyroll fold domain-containing protein, partial [Candidatus Sulfotelmatobacter sp.]|nr:LamG-like jellyroll fold domain-containing protein [Candidatus Sulfotelmatobacter sp.]
DPASSSVLAFDYAGGFNGTYGAGLQNGNPLYNIAGPTPGVSFPGFDSNNKAAQFANGTGTARLTVQPWNLNTNTVTITAWVNPGSYQANNAGLVFCRGGGTVAGLNYTATQDPISGMNTLGYTWNNEWETWNWNSGLVPPSDQWSLVALVITPTNATVHVMNATGLVSSSRPYAHVPQSFSGTTLIGDDSNDGGNGTRVFNGIIDDVAVFSSALSPAQLVALYSAASGQTQFAPVIAVQPASYQSLYAGQTAQFTVGAGGSPTLQYQWQKGTGGVYANLNNGAMISGATTPTLTIAGVQANDAADYVVKITNPYGTITSSPSSLYVQSTLGAETITLSTQQPGGNDWDSADWSDGMGASLSAAMKPGSTYEVLPGARLRSPQNPRTAIFPGNVLTLSGDGVWTNNPAATNPPTIGELRIKQPNPGTVIFKKLVMKGGQIDVGNDGVAGIGGQIDFQTNAPFYNDGGNDRGYQIDAWLTGTGTIEYHGYNQGSFMPGYTNNLNITGTSNTFKGKWNVVIGTLLGTGLNALGANDITVGANGALETTYDI